MKKSTFEKRAIVLHPELSGEDLRRNELEETQRYNQIMNDIVRLVVSLEKLPFSFTANERRVLLTRRLDWLEAKITEYLTGTL